MATKSSKERGRHTGHTRRAHCGKRGDFPRACLRLDGVRGPSRRRAQRHHRIHQRLERELRMLGKRVARRANPGALPYETQMGRGPRPSTPVNDLIEDLVRPNSEMARVISAVANGDSSQTMPMEIEGRRLQGQFLETARTVNTMVDQLRSFSSSHAGRPRGGHRGQARRPGAGCAAWRRLEGPHRQWSTQWPAS